MHGYPIQKNQRKTIQKGKEKSFFLSTRHFGVHTMDIDYAINYAIGFPELRFYQNSHSISLILVFVLYFVII